MGSKSAMSHLHLGDIIQVGRVSKDLVNLCLVCGRGGVQAVRGQCRLLQSALEGKILCAADLQ